MSWTVIEADGNGVRETRRGGTLTGEVEPEAKAKRGDAMAYTNIEPSEMLAAEMDRQLKALDKWAKEWAEQDPEPKPKLVTWRLCNTHGFWFPSNKIPKGWVALESQTLPVETIKQLPEGQKP